ncbi:MAG: glutamine amidotransferase, partial [Pirellulaceae bacterium]
MTRFGLQPIYDSTLLVAVFAIAIVFVIIAIGPRAEKLTPTRRRWLIGLRIAAALVLLLGMLRPSLIISDNRAAPATLAVLLDGSRSMTLPAGDGQDRATVQRHVWEQLGPFLTNVEDDTLSIEVLHYAGDVQTLPLEAVDPWTKETPDGAETNLAKALQGAISAASGRPLVGVILVGDGTQTAEVSGAGAQQTARTLAALEVPLWTVPIGPPGGSGAARDVAVDDVPESLRVFSGNTFNLSATVRSQSLVGVDIPVHVRLIDETGPADGVSTGKELASRGVVPRIASDSQEVDFDLVAPPPGRYRLEVIADEQAGEAINTNNRQVAFLDVQEGGGRILYLEGEIRQEQTYLRRALRRFPDLELVFRWIARDTVDGWPVQIQEALRPNQFDVFIIGDLDADAIGDAQLEQLAERISDGAGLLMLGGFQTLDVGGYASSPLASVVPIQMDASLRTTIDQQAPERAMLPGPIRPQVARRHPITILGNSTNPQTDWDRLKPFLGANRLRDIKVAPGVQVLLESPDQDPLLVVGEYGNGRVAVMAADSTWQWWRQGQSDAHRRFWRQVMLWLLSREGLSDDTIEVELDSRRYAADRPPEFRVRLRSLQESNRDIELAAEIVKPDGSVLPVTVTPQPATAGEVVVGGTMPELDPGLYRLRGFSPNAEDGNPAPDERAFQVVDDDRERARPLADPAMLEQLSALTVTAGGRVYTPEQIDELMETIRKDRRESVSPVIDRKRLGDDPLSGWLLFLVFVALLTA